MRTIRPKRLKERGAAYATREPNKPRGRDHHPFPQARYLTSKERVALEAYRDHLLAKLPGQIERIVLFGSKARGDSSRDSDIDLLITVNGPPIQGLGSLDPRWNAIVDPTFDFLMEYGIYISPTVMHTNATKKWTPLLSHVEEDGVDLWRK